MRPSHQARGCWVVPTEALGSLGMELSQGSSLPSQSVLVLLFPRPRLPHPASGKTPCSTTPGWVGGLGEGVRKSRRSRVRASPQGRAGTLRPRRQCSRDPRPVPSAPLPPSPGAQRSAPLPPTRRLLGPGRPKRSRLAPPPRAALRRSASRAAQAAGGGARRAARSRGWRARGARGLRTHAAGRAARASPSPAARARAAVTSRAARQPRAPAGRARAAAEHMGPRAGRARGGLAPDGQRGAARRDRPRHPLGPPSGFPRGEDVGSPGDLPRHSGIHLPVS